MKIEMRNQFATEKRVFVDIAFWHFIVNYVMMEYVSILIACRI